MVTISKKGVFVFRGQLIKEDNGQFYPNEIDKQLIEADLEPLSLDRIDKATARTGTITHKIVTDHNRSGDWRNLKIRFDSLASHDITYVGIVQTAKASGLEAFPVPYVLTNCHNSLCAVGGTINEDDHQFGLSAARKYGGIFVPAHLAVIHQYVREMMAGCGKMILGSDSHTRYGALGTMGIGEGGPELVKQLLEKTYDLPYPEVVVVYLEGEPPKGTGPHDVAMAIIGAVFHSGYVKNKIMEFIGPGISSLSVDFRNGIDVMTTETSCLSTVWRTDDKVKEYYRTFDREEAFSPLAPEGAAYYDGLVRVNLSEVEPMIALPFHPSNVYKISTFKENTKDILQKTDKEAEVMFGGREIYFSLMDKLDGEKIKIDQGIVAGCSGGLFENISAMADIIAKGTVDNSDFNLSVYPASQPVYLSLIKNKTIEKLVSSGVVVRSAFCGPCFGAGDTPSNEALSIRHTTRNFPNREGSNPGEGQIAAVALMDARSIAATFKNGGYLTSAAETGDYAENYAYRYEKDIYEKKVYNGYNKPLKKEALVMGPNIVDWPEMDPLPPNLLLKVVSILTDPVTTTDELIPSGETASFRSNPLRLAEFTLSRKDPGYVDRAKEIQKLYNVCKKNAPDNLPPEIKNIYTVISSEIDPFADIDLLSKTAGIGSLVYALKPGDGSAREQAASCQKVLGTWANIAKEYATKRYQSNCVNWGIIPFIYSGDITDLSLDSFIYVPEIRQLIEKGSDNVVGWILAEGKVKKIKLRLSGLTEKDRKILLAGNLINYQANNRE
jgi:aconitate hydratase